MDVLCVSKLLNNTIKYYIVFFYIFYTEDFIQKNGYTMQSWTFGHYKYDFKSDKV